MVGVVVATVSRGSSRRCRVVDRAIEERGVDATSDLRGGIPEGVGL